MAWLERQEPSATAYLALPASGIVGVLLALLLLLGVQGVRGRYAGNAPGA